MLRVTNRLPPDWWQQAPLDFFLSGNGNLATACACQHHCQHLHVSISAASPGLRTALCRKPVACCTTMVPDGAHAELVSAPGLSATAEAACPGAVPLAPTALSVTARIALSPAHTPRRRVEPYASLTGCPAHGTLHTLPRSSPIHVSDKDSTERSATIWRRSGPSTCRFAHQ